MARKYKIFVKDESISFGQKDRINTSETRMKLNDSDARILEHWVAVLRKLHIEKSEEVLVYDLDVFLINLFAHFPVVFAGGGFVLNDNDEVLMIHRRGFWDLPKGKLDHGETIQECALREVTEECGVFNHKILSGPFHTYHMYREFDGRVVIKDSAWFLMKAEGIQNLRPQTEEGIDRVIWQKLPIEQGMFNGAYDSIKDVITYYQAELNRVR